jgi:hypothetical protein
MENEERDTGWDIVVRVTTGLLVVSQLCRALTGCGW